jgi:hypothetical protein
MTGSISDAQAERVMNGEPAPDEWFDEVGVMCGWDARKARVRATLQPYFGTTHITFVGVPAGDERVTQLRNALYARIAERQLSPPRRVRKRRTKARKSG